MSQRRNANFSNHTASSTRDARRSSDSYESLSTAATSLSGSSRPSTKSSDSRAPRSQSTCHNEDLSPSTSLHPRSSVETYTSQESYDEFEDMPPLDFADCSEIPPLPVYRHEIEEVNVRPSTAEDFAALFPSMNRLTIRHDDFTSDGNMNLRVDTVVSGRRKRTIQLFHLRMHDLAKREFSLRRYCRDSGREVCNSKRKYTDPSSTSHVTIPRSVSSAMKSISGRPTLSRSPTANSMFTSKSRPGTSSTAGADDTFMDDVAHGFSPDKKQKARSLPTNTIKLEFSNYARVDIERRGQSGKRYEFEWWSSKYSWKRVVDKLTGAVSFHLLVDGNNSKPVAHIVPETRAPNQIEVDERAGGWVPPCHMWISDESLLTVKNTFVADIVVATGLMALVDDCIKQRWCSGSKIRRLSLPLTSKSMDVEFAGPRAFVQHLFTRRYSEHHSSSPLRHQKTVAAY